MDYSDMNFTDDDASIDIKTSKEVKSVENDKSQSTMQLGDLPPKILHELEEQELKRKIEYKTDTSSFNSSEMVIVSPEQADEEAKEAKMESVVSDGRFTNQEFGIAVSNIEAKLGRKINYDEFDKMCRSYATVLCERDADIRRTNKNQPVVVDPAYRDEYYKKLIKNEKVDPAYKMHLKAYEESMIGPISSLYDEYKNTKIDELKVEDGKPINMRYKGKVAISEDKNGQVIVIDNDADTKLLHMQHRKNWLDKRFPDQIKGVSTADHHNDDGFE